MASQSQNGCAPKSATSGVAPSGAESSLAELSRWCAARAVECGTRAEDPALAESLQLGWAMSADTFACVMEKIDDMDPANATPPLSAQDTAEQSGRGRGEAALVERVSRAIATAKRARNLRGPVVIDKVWRAYCGQARAAIAEMRDPFANDQIHALETEIRNLRITYDKRVGYLLAQHEKRLEDSADFQISEHLRQEANDRAKTAEALLASPRLVVGEGSRDEIDNLSKRLEEAREALRPITWQDIRLCVGEGRLNFEVVFAAMNAILASRARSSLSNLSPTVLGEGGPSVADSALAVRAASPGSAEVEGGGD